MSETFSDLVRCHGIILFTEHFDACVAFYRDTLGLPVWFEKPGLVCLRFGDGYLMVETEGVANQDTPTKAKSVSENPTKLRFNVKDVEAAARLLESKGVSVEINVYDWGTTGTFLDPDGNICALKDADDPFFE
jgi:lactoylglutathione lyase